MKSILFYFFSLAWMMVPMSESVGPFTPYVHHIQNTFTPSLSLPRLIYSTHDTSGSFVESRYSITPSIRNISSTNLPMKSKYANTNVSHHSILLNDSNVNETMVSNHSIVLNETIDEGYKSKTSKASALCHMLSIVQLLIGCAYHLE